MGNILKLLLTSYSMLQEVLLCLLPTTCCVIVLETRLFGGDAADLKAHQGGNLLAGTELLSSAESIPNRDAGISPADYSLLPVFIS